MSLASLETRGGWTRVHRFAAYLLGVQGIAHAFYAGVAYQALSLDALMFAGTGLGWLFLALLNLMQTRAPSAASARVTVTANILALGYFLVLARAAPDWKVAVAILLTATCTVGSWTALGRSGD